MDTITITSSFFFDDRARQSILNETLLLGLISLQGGPKSKPLPNYQKIVLNRIKVSNEIRFLRQIKEMINHYNIIRRY